MDHFRTCYNVKFSDVPTVAFKLPAVPTREKIEDCLISNAPPAMPTKGWSGCRPTMLVLTADNWLDCYDLETGQRLHHVFLSHKHKFRHIEWDCDERSFVLKSLIGKHNFSRQTNNSPPVVAIALFSVWPLQFTGLLEVHKKVFGADVKDAHVNQQCLIVLHSMGFVRLYSMQHILSEGKLHQSNGSSSARVTDSSSSCGFPVDIILNERPPVLFEVRCFRNDITLGGRPWHYIITPYNLQGRFHVNSVSEHQLASGGVLEMDACSVEPELCAFHDDDSGRILQVGANKVRIYKFVEEDIHKFSSDGNKTSSARYQVKEVFAISAPEKSTVQHGDIYTQSGRLVRRHNSENSNIFLDLMHEPIKAVTYEDELDVLVVTQVQQCLDDDGYTAHVHLHDNQTGKLLKTINLVEKWDTADQHVVTVDLDTLLHMTKRPNGKHHCFIYRLHRRLDRSTTNSDQLLSTVKTTLRSRQTRRSRARGRVRRS